MHIYKRLFNKIKGATFNRLCHSESKVTATITKKKRISHSEAIKSFFLKNKEIGELAQHVPSKYLELKRRREPDHLYLICPSVAKTIASHVIPAVKKVTDQVICETNAGLGLITTQLLEGGVRQVRLYENCPEFRENLKDFGYTYPGRVELFTRDLFQLNRYAQMDKYDKTNRVEMLLKNVPKRPWDDEPVMTIIGTVPSLAFLKYLVLCIALQNNVASYGRMQLFAIMRPKHYAMPITRKFPRNVFLPWGPNTKPKRPGYYLGNLETDKMCLVKITHKKSLPVPSHYLLPFYYFVRQFYGKGTNRIIPTVEKWVPGCGLNMIVPQLNHGDEFFDDIDLFTKFCELTPNQVVSVFKEMAHNPGYLGSPFTAMTESELLKFETIETVLSEATQSEQNIAEEIEEKA